MDFVVLGFGVGALAVLLGLAARDLGPMVRRLPRDGSMSWAEVAERVSWGRACRAGGLVAALTGAALCLVTGAVLLARVSDGTGMLVVLGGAVGAVLAIAAWAIRYRMHSEAPIGRPTRDDRPDKKTGTNRPRRSGRSARRGTAEMMENDDVRRGDVETVSREATARSGRGSNLERRRVVDAPPMGALTVDAMGGLRRAPVTMPAVDDAPVMDPVTPTRDPGREPPRQMRNERPRQARPTGGNDRRG